MYLQDYDEVFIDGYPGSPPTTATYGRGWAGKLFPYIRNTNAGILECPDDLTVSQAGGYGPVSYSYNANLVGGATLGPTQQGGSHQISQLVSPALTILAHEVSGMEAAFQDGPQGLTELDSPGDLGICANTAYPPAPLTMDESLAMQTPAAGYTSFYNGTTAPGFVFLQAANRHTGGSNYMFADGHVKFLEPGVVAVPSVFVRFAGAHMNLASR